MQKAGYIPTASFVLPESCWIDNFYVPQVSTQDDFLKKYKGNKMIEQFIANEKYEAELYYKYKQYYGYVFYIGKNYNYTILLYKLTTYFFIMKFNCCFDFYV